MKETAAGGALFYFLLHGMMKHEEWICFSSIMLKTLSCVRLVLYVNQKKLTSSCSIGDGLPLKCDGLSAVA